MTYLLDTNIFITAKNELPIDVYPSFWQALSQLAANGSFKSIKKVEDEIRKGKDELVDWNWLIGLTIICQKVSLLQKMLKR